MYLYKIAEKDHQTNAAASVSLAELKAIYNALSIDTVSGIGTSPGVDLSQLLVKIQGFVTAYSPPEA